MRFQRYVRRAGATRGMTLVPTSYAYINSDILDITQVFLGNNNSKLTNVIFCNRS